MRPIHIGLLGLGTVGGGVVDLLARNRDEIARRTGRVIRATCAAVRDPARSRAPAVAAAVAADRLRIVSDFRQVTDDPDIDIVVELVGGVDPAGEMLLRAIRNGKHVVTANKALVATRGDALFAAARAHGAMFGLEATVAGGIPILKALREGLAANRIAWLAGIINGTANFILTEMRDRGLSFPQALAEARRLGYAEADPTFDVEGVDAAHKLAILASIAFGMPLCFDRVATEGIADIDPRDVVYAGELGYRIKHLGIARRTAAGVELRVHPTLIPERSSMAHVDGVMNAVLAMGDAVGPTFYGGAGAGAAPTASAVVADLIDIVRALDRGSGAPPSPLGFQPEALQRLPTLALEEVETACYLRLQVDDRPGVLADITRILGELEIGIEAFLQKDGEGGGGEGESVPLILLLYPTREGRVNRAIAAIEALECVREKAVRIRMETLRQ